MNIKNIKRIAVIGNAGSGKSTLAKQLHDILGLPVYHLDQYFWGPNWTHPDPDEYKAIHDKLCDKEEWIMDGCNLRVFDYRAQRANMIIFLDMPRYLCLWRIFKRLFRYYGKQAPNSAKGCHEGINCKFFAFLKWVWQWNKKYPQKIKAALSKIHNTEIRIFKSQKELDKFLNTLRN